MATSEIVSSASTTVKAERGRRAASILSVVCALASDVDAAIAEDDLRTEASRRLGDDEFMAAPSDGDFAFADETIVTDAAPDRAAVLVVERELSMAPLATTFFCSAADRGGSC
jgi:hypothetical protein